MGFESRCRQGEAAKKRLIKYLETKGYTVARVGQEDFKDKIALRFDYSLTALQVRHMPDLLCSKDTLPSSFRIEVKSTRKIYQKESHPNFSIETASLDICKMMAETVLVAIVWENKPNEFYAIWAENVQPHYREETLEDKPWVYQGSNTPMCLVYKSDIPSIDEFLDYLVGDF